MVYIKYAVKSISHNSKYCFLFIAPYISYTPLQVIFLKKYRINRTLFRAVVFIACEKEYIQETLVLIK